MLFVSRSLPGRRVVAPDFVSDDGFMAAFERAIRQGERCFAWHDDQQKPRHGDAFVAQEISSCDTEHTSCRPPGTRLIHTWTDWFDRAHGSDCGQWRDFYGREAGRQKYEIVWSGRPELTTSASPNASRQAGSTDHWQRTGEARHHFTARVADAEAACTRGELDKVVLARSVTVRAPSGQQFAPAATVARLRATEPGAVIFAVADGRGRCFVGATPELLMRANGGQIHSHALAGTRARGLNRRQDERLAAELLADDKERREHAVVVDRLLASLRPLCQQIHGAPRPQVRKLARLMHLETPIAGRLRDGIDWRQAVDALHPTPAVCGEPRHPALAWLREREALDRGLYAGQVGWSDNAGRGACAVAIRSVLLDGDRATAFAGAGIVAGSRPEAEWDETESKLQTALAALVLEPTHGR